MFAEKGVIELEPCSIVPLWILLSFATHSDGAGLKKSPDPFFQRI